MEKRKKEIPAEEAALFCEQMLLILQGGIVLYEGMDLLAESMEQEKSRKIFEEMSREMKQSASFSKTIKSIGCFPKYMVRMVEIGEKTGELEKVLSSLCTYYEREARIQKAIQNAIVYPILLIVMLTAVIGVFLMKILPVFLSIFERLGTSMSAVGKTTIRIGIVTGQISCIFVVVLLMLFLIIPLLMKNEKGKRKLKGLLIHVPLIKHVYKKMLISRFSSAFALMEHSGFSMENSMEQLEELMEDPAMKERVRLCAQSIKDGDRFASSIEKLDLYPRILSRMIQIGYQSGQLDAVLQKVAKTYEDEIEESVANLVSFIEPTIVAVLSVVIGAILLSVMLPLASIMSSIG